MRLTLKTPAIGVSVAPLCCRRYLCLLRTVFEAVQEAGLLPGALGSLSIADSEPFNLSSFALSLLLVRRTQLSNCRALYYAADGRVSIYLFARRRA